MTQPLTVEVWSDVVCPWCYIGKRRFDRAVAELAADDDPIEVEVIYRPYQLDPTADPDRSGPVAEAYAKKFGGPEQARQIIDNVTEIAAGEGLDFHLDRALRANTLRAHRLIWLAAQPDSPVEQGAVKERLMQAYFVDGVDVGDPATLTDLAVEMGLDRDEIVDFLASDAAVEPVRQQLNSAAEFGITAVPTYVVNGQFAIPGAQETNTFVRAMRRVAERV